MEEIPKDFTCECGEVHPFGFYVAAHADILLTHTCEKCRAQHYIKRYHVWLKKKGKKRLATSSV
jgi:hypothetical protein